MVRSCPRTRCSAGLVDDVAYEDQVDDKLRAGEQRRHLDGDDYARVSLASLGLNRGPRIAVIYAAGTINGGKSGYDPVNGAGRSAPTRSSSTSARRGATARCARSCCASTAPADRRSASDAIWRELMIAKTRARRPAARRVDVGSRRVGRLLHRDAGAGDRRAAVDAHRIDRHLRRQVRHRRRLREARRAHRVDEHRPARRDQLAGAPLQPRGS